MVLFRVMLSPPTGTGPRLKNQSSSRPPPDSGCENVTACISLHRQFVRLAESRAQGGYRIIGRLTNDVVARLDRAGRGPVVEPRRARHP